MPEVHTEYSLSDKILHAEVAYLTPASAEKIVDNLSSMILEGEGRIDDADNAADFEF